MDEDYGNVFQKACLIQLSTSVWMGSKMLDQTLMTKVSEQRMVERETFPHQPGTAGTAAHVISSGSEPGAAVLSTVSDHKPLPDSQGIPGFRG